MPEQEVTTSVLGGCKRFECQVVGLPRPSIRWYKDGVNVTTHPRYKFEYTPDGCVVLVLENVTLKDEGVYACRAQNCEGSAETSAQLYVKETSVKQEEDLTSVCEMAFRRSRDFSDRKYSSSRWSSASSEDSILGMGSRSFIEESSSYSVGRSGDYRRKTTYDSGITSRGSSFSSDSDISFSSDSKKEMKKYLQGRTENSSSYQVVENGTMHVTDNMTEKSESISAIRKAARERARAKQAKENGTIEIDSTDINFDVSSSSSRFKTKEDSTRLKSGSAFESHTIEKQTFSESFVSVEKSPNLPDTTVMKEQHETKIVELSSETLKAGEAPLKKITSLNVQKEFETAKTEEGEDEVTIIETETFIEEGVLHADDKKGLEKVKRFQTDQLDITTAEEKTNSMASEIVDNERKVSETDNLNTDKTTKPLVKDSEKLEMAKEIVVAEKEQSIDTNQSKSTKITEVSRQKQAVVQEVLQAKEEEVEEMFEVSKSNKGRFQETSIKIEELTAETKSNVNVDETLSRAKRSSREERAQLEVVQPFRSASEERRRGKMIREEEHPGKLDHLTKDDKEGRIMAGKYLFYNETSEQEEYTKHEIAHEVHFMYKADNLEATDAAKQPMQTVTKEVATPYDQYESVKSATSEREFEKIQETQLASQTEHDVTVESKVEEMSVTTSKESVSAVEVQEKIQAKTSMTVQESQKDALAGQKTEESMVAEQAEQEHLATPEDKEDKKIYVEVLSDSEIIVNEGESTQIQWRIKSISIDEVNVYKAGSRVTIDDVHKLIKDTDNGIVTFKVMSALKSDTAVYSVRLQTSTVNEGQVNLKVTPKLKTPEADFELLTDPNITVDEGEKLEIRWKISGISLDKVGVFKDGVKITEKEGLMINSKDDIYTLTVQSATPADEATYSVRPQGSDSDKGQTKVKVITESRVEIFGEKSEIIVVEKERIVIRWRVIGVTKRKIIIRKNGKKVEEDNRSKVSFEDNIYTLAIDTAEKDDSATYSIQIEGSDKDEGQTKVKVVASEPRIVLLTDESQIIVKEGDRAYVRWKITRVTRKKVTVRKNGKTLDESENVKISLDEDICELTLTAVTQEDSAIYSVNVEGSDDEEGQIEVKVISKDAKIEVTTDKSELTVNEKEKISLRWRITGIEANMVTVMKNGYKVSVDDRCKLSFSGDSCLLDISSACLDDGATYSVSISGSEVTESKVKVKVVAMEESTPETTSKPKDTKTVDDKPEPAVTEVPGKDEDVKPVDEDIISAEKKPVDQKIPVTSDEDKPEDKAEGPAKDTKQEETIEALDEVDAGVKTDEVHEVEEEVTPTKRAEEKTTPSKDEDKPVVQEEEITPIKKDKSETAPEENELEKNEKKVQENEVIPVEKETTEIASKKEEKEPEEPIPEVQEVQIKQDNKEKIESIPDISEEKVSEPSEVPKEVTSITTDQEEITVNDGEKLTIRWKITGVSHDDITILKDSLDVANDSHFKVAFDGEACVLTVDAAISSDQAVYGVKVKGSDVQGQVQVKVKCVPKVEVLTDESAASLDEGNSLDIKWKITGATEPDITILKDDIEIKLDEKCKVTFEGEICTLSFETVSDLDEGLYSVKVKDTEVKDGAIKVKVTQAPKVEVMTEEQSVSLKEGETLELKWKITGTAKGSTVEVCKDKQPAIQDETHTQQLTEDVCTYTVTSTSPADEGSYSVKVNGTDKLEGQTEVKVTPVPKVKVSTEQSDEVVEEGESLTMTWEISGAPKSDVRILKDGSQIKPAKNLKVKFDNGTCALTFNPVSNADEATYAIKVKGLDTEQGQIKVKVISQPKVSVTADESEKEAVVGEGLSMAWKISGASKSEVRIFKDGSQIKPAKSMKLKFENEQCTLTFNPISKSDEAIYSIKVKGLDQEQGQIKVKVNEEPKILVSTEQSEKSVIAGESLSMAWKISGVSKSDVRILKDGSQIKPAKNMKLKFNNGDCILNLEPVSLCDEAIYAIKVKGIEEELGMIKVKVTQKPEVKEPVDEVKKDAPEVNVEAEVSEEKLQKEPVEIETKVETSESEKKVDRSVTGTDVKTDKGSDVQAKADVTAESGIGEKPEEEPVVTIDTSTAETEEKTDKATVEVQAKTDVAAASEIGEKPEEEPTEIKPVIEISTDEMEKDVSEGDELSMKWNIKGASKSDVILLKDGSIIEPAENMELKFMDEECILTLSSASSTDQATYSIEVKGMEKNQGQIKIKVTPENETVSVIEKQQIEVVSDIGEVDKIKTGVSTTESKTESLVLSDAVSVDESKVELSEVSAELESTVSKPGIEAEIAERSKISEVSSKTEISTEIESEMVRVSEHAPLEDIEDSSIVITKTEVTSSESKEIISETPESVVSTSASTEDVEEIIEIVTAEMEAVTEVVSTKTKIRVKDEKVSDKLDEVQSQAAQETVTVTEFAEIQSEHKAENKSLKGETELTAEVSTTITETGSVSEIMTSKTEETLSQTSAETVITQPEDMFDTKSFQGNEEGKPSKAKSEDIKIGKAGSDEAKSGLSSEVKSDTKGKSENISAEIKATSPSESATFQTDKDQSEVELDATVKSHVDATKEITDAKSETETFSEAEVELTVSEIKADDTPVDVKTETSDDSTLVGTDVDEVRPKVVDGDQSSSFAGKFIIEEGDSLKGAMKAAFSAETPSDKTDKATDKVGLDEKITNKDDLKITQKEDQVEEKIEDKVVNGKDAKEIDENLQEIQEGEIAKPAEELAHQTLEGDKAKDTKPAEITEQVESSVEEVSQQVDKKKEERSSQPSLKVETDEKVKSAEEKSVDLNEKVKSAEAISQEVNEKVKSTEEKSVEVYEKDTIEKSEVSEDSKLAEEKVVKSDDTKPKEKDKQKSQNEEKALKSLEEKKSEDAKPTEESQIAEQFDKVIDKTVEANKLKDSKATEKIEESETAEKKGDKDKFKDSKLTEKSEEEKEVEQKNNKLKEKEKSKEIKPTENSEEVEKSEKKVDDLMEKEGQQTEVEEKVKPVKHKTDKSLEKEALTDTKLAVQISPLETSKVVKERESLSMAWKVEGAAKADIKILKDGVQIKPAENLNLKFDNGDCTLTLNPVSSADEGTYSIKVKGLEQDQGNIKVKVKPEVKPKPKPKEPKVEVSTKESAMAVTEGDTLSMAWNIKGAAKSDVRILKDGNQIKPAKNMKLKFDNGDCMLSFSPVSKTDEATYSIKVKGLDQEQGQIKVKVEPVPKIKVRTLEKEKIVKEEDTLCMAWTIEGAQKSDVRILKDGNQIKPAKNMKLKFDNGDCMLSFSPVSKTDEATYSIKVKGLDKEQGQIKVKVEPVPELKVTTLEKEKIVKEEETLCMAWTIEGAQKSDVRILKDGNQIKPAKNMKLKFDNGDCMLSFSPVSKTDEATYSIKVKGLDKEQGQIKVKVEPVSKVKVTTLEKEKIVKEEDILCMAWTIEGAAKSDVKILKDGNQIKPAKNMKLKFDNGDCMLSFSPVSKTDEATYSIKVKGLDKEQGQIKVKVEPVPKVKVTTLEKEKKVKEDETLCMAWNIKGAAKSDVRILKDGSQIKPAKNMKLKFDNGDCTLTFNPVSVSEEATYSVKVKGLEGEQGHIKVKVTPEPKVEAMTGKSSVSEGDSLDLKWNVTGAVESDISIFKDGSKLKDDSTHKFTFTGTEAALSIKPVTKDDEGNYGVKIKGQNKTEGQTSVKVTVKKEPKPSEPKPVEAVQEIIESDTHEPVCEVLEDWPDPDDWETLNSAPKPAKPKIQEEPVVAEKTEEKMSEKVKEIEVVESIDEKAVDEGNAFEIQWKLNGADINEVEVCKDGLKVKPDDKLKVAVEKDVCSLKIEESTLTDEATYSVKRLNSEVHEGQIFVKVAVDKNKVLEPSFVDEPTLEIVQDRRLSLKCAVTGYPAPEVTWYHEGQQLGQDALWDVYTREGYHYLAANNQSFIDGSEIICRVQNQAGHQQYAVAVKQDGNEVYCDPVLPPVSMMPELEMKSSPTLEVTISETSGAKLKKYTVITDFLDDLNGISLCRGDHVQLLNGCMRGTALARRAEKSEEVCYIPKQLLTGDDLRKQECRNLLGTKITQPFETQAYTVTGTEQTGTMPERRKMRSSSPQMTSTPKVKRKGYEDDDTSEMRSRLGLKDNVKSKTEVSHESVELTSEYTDGTTRPTFKKRLRNTTANAGELVQLECVVSGSPLPKVLWLKNNRPLKASDGCKVIIDEDKNILVFPSAKDEDVGIYTARAMNVNGSIMCSAEFNLKEGKSLPAQTVTESPMDLDFTTPAYFFQMSSCEVTEGRLARFDCRVVAYPKPEIVWMRDGKVIETSDRFKLLNFNNEIYSLLIQDVQLSDTGRYTCWARNKFGEAMTEAYLNVIAFKDQEEEGDIAPKFLTRFYDQQTTEGTPTDFKCLIAGRPEPSVTWLLDDIELTDSPGVRLRKKEGVVSLELKSPKTDQSGQYTCQLKNTLGEATCSAKLTVIEDKLKGKMLPKFLKKFDHVNAKEGEEVKFTCVVVGEPKPNVIWMYNHKPISDTNRHYSMKKEGDAYTLLIKDVRFDDKGIITCKASNEEGEVYISANLHVRESKILPESPDKDRVKEAEPKDSKFGYVPTFTKRLEDVAAKEGTSARFECRFMGMPEPEVSWMKDGRVILPGGRYHMTYSDGTCRLSIDNVTSSDTGVYTCIISNSQGKSSSTASLKLEGEKKDKYIPEKPVKRELFTPDKYAVEDKPYTRPAKRVYEDLEKIEVKARPRRYSFDSSILPSKYSDISSQTIPKRTYESPSRYESPLRYGSPGRYESPKRRDRPKSAYELPKSFDLSRSFDSPKSYESPRKYESTKRYESPKRFESPKMYDFDLYESPKRYESPKYESPKYDSARRFESPKREKMDDIAIVPKLPYDRPSIHNKHEDSVRLSWLPAPTGLLPIEAKQVTYIVESRELPRQDWIRVGSHVPVTSYLVKNLRPDKEYEFRIRAQNIHGVSEPTWSAPLEKRVDMAKKFADLPEMRAPPRLPTRRPIVTDMGEDILRLAWRPAETYQAKRAPPVSYRLEAKELPGKDWMPLSSRLRDTSHYLSELPLDRDYMIRVRAENDFGLSEPTEPLWLPRARAFPGVPVGRPEIIEVEDTRAKLSWTRVDIPTFGLNDEPLLYMLEVEEPPYDWRTIARELDDTEYIVEGLKPGKDYRFRIRAKTPAGVISEPSPAASLYSTLARSRAPVDRLEIVDYEPDSRSVNLQWERVDIPPYSHEEEPLLYMLEYQEPPMPEWRSLVAGIPTTKYRVMHLDPDREYNFRVRAVTPYGVSPPSPVLPVTVRKTPVPSIRPLAEPVIISEIEPDTLRLTWKRPMHDLATPITYKVEMLEFPLSDWKCIASSIPETTYRVTGLRPNRDYQFRVTPQMDRRYLDPLPPVSLTSSTGEPESATRFFMNLIEKERVRPRLPLTEPTLKELTSESVALHWKPAEVPVYQRSRAPLYYMIEMLELPSSTWTPVARRVPDTSYTVTGLRPDQDYKFRIKADINGSLSEPTLAAVLHRRPVPKFPRKEPTIKDISPNIVQLSWQPAMLPAGFEDITYRVEIQSPPGIATWNTLYASHPTPTVRLADLRPDLDYLVRVRAVGKDFVSEPTMPVYIPRRAVPPRMQQEEPYCVDINPDSVRLQWRSADLPTHIMDYSPITYRLEAQEMPNGEWVTVARGIPHTDFKVTGLNPLRDYSFRVRAENDYGVSDPTRPVAVQKRAVAPVLPHDEPMMFDVGAGSVRLTWRPATLPSHVKSTSPITYTIFVQELPFKAWRPLVKKIPHTSYYISGLQPDKEYNFRIQAENQHGQSRPTQAVYMSKYTDIKKPISIPEVSDFDEDLTFVKLRWKPSASPLFDKSPRKYQIESWEPVKREWKPVARGIKDTSYKLRDLPKLPDHLFRVRMETDQAELSEPSLPVSVSRHISYPRRPVYRPQLFEFDNDSVRLSWQPATLPEGVSRRSIRYVIEQREIPDMHWHTIASDVTETSYRVRGLRPKSDYEFRIRVFMSGTTSEPSFPVALYRRPVIPRVQLQAPEVHDVDETTIKLHWNKVDVPQFTNTDEPLMFMIERQTLPGYRWEPIAMDIADTSYTVRNLKPYQDYNFRVRGVFPSGYTDPSPYVPVFRRPSESKKSTLGLYTVDDSDITTTSQMYSSQNIPSHSLRASLPSDYSPAIRNAKQSRLINRTFSPKRRFSMSQIYDISDKNEVKEAPFRSSIIPPAQFKREEAYVYKRETTPAITTEFKPVKITHIEAKSRTYEKKHDLYDYYRKLRRHSDAGIEDLRRSRSENSRERELQARREIMIMETDFRNRRRASQSPVTKRPVVAGSSDYDKRYPSVADRYEDIKCPHVVRPGKWSFARRHSIALDDQDLEYLKRAQAKVKSKTQSTMRSKYISKTDLDLELSRPKEELYGDTYFIIEDDMNVDRAQPRSRVSRVDVNIPSHFRSISHDKEPGYFVFSKFSLSVTGTKRSSPRPGSYVRPASVEPSPVLRAPVRATSYDKFSSSTDNKYRKRSQSFSFTKSNSEWETLSKSVQQQIEKAQELRRNRRSRTSEQLARQTRAGSMSFSKPYTDYQRESSPKSYSRPRSSSISYASSERPAKFNALVENSKSLVARSSERGFSIDKKMQSSQTGYRSRAGSVSTTVDTTKPRSYSVSDVKSDPRFSANRRASITATQITVEKRSSVADVKSDPRFGVQRRSTISTNDDLKSKLDTLTSNLSVAKPKVKKSSRPVIKFKSSHGEGYVTETHIPKSDKLKNIYHKLT